jgi:hypothetical protein
MTISKTQSNLEKGKANRLAYNNSVNTKIGFMDYKASLYGRSLQDSTLIGTGPMTVWGDTISATKNIKDNAKFMKAAKELLYVMIPSMDNNEEDAFGGSGKFKLTNKKFNLNVELRVVIDGKKARLVVMNERIANEVLKAIKQCDLNDVRNMRKIFRVLNDIYRMYQEMTIDAAKKMYSFKTPFYTDVIRAESTIHLTHSFNGFESAVSDKDNIFGTGKETTLNFEISRKGMYHMDNNKEIGDTQRYYNDYTGELEKVLVRDDLAIIQDKLARETEKRVKSDLLDAYKEIELSDETVKDFSVGGEMGRVYSDVFEMFVKTLNKTNLWFRDSMTNAKAKYKAFRNGEYNEQTRNLVLNELQYSYVVEELKNKLNTQLDNLSNMVRFFLRDFNMVDAGRIMFAASNGHNYRGNFAVNTANDINKNKFYMRIAPELFMAYFFAEHSPVKDSGFKLYGDYSSLVDGDPIEFNNGFCFEHPEVMIDSSYTGKLVVKTIDDVKYATVDVIELLEANRVSCTAPEMASIRVSANYLIDRDIFEKQHEIRYIKGTDCFSKFVNQGLFSDADSFTLMPVFRYKNSKGQNQIKFNVMVANVGDKVIPCCQYLCFSQTFENAFAGLTFDKIEKFDTKVEGKDGKDGRTAWLRVKYGNFVEVERRSMEDEDVFNNSDFDESKHKDLLNEIMKPMVEKAKNNIEGAFGGSDESYDNDYSTGTYDEYSCGDYSDFDDLDAYNDFQ